MPVKLVTEERVVKGLNWWLASECLQTGLKGSEAKLFEAHCGDVRATATLGAA